MRGRYKTVLLTVVLLFLIGNIYFLFKGIIYDPLNRVGQKFSDYHSGISGEDSSNSSSSSSSSSSASVSPEPTVVYNHGERAPQYSAGMEEIKYILNRFTEIPPGVESLQDYNRTVGDDMDMIRGGEISLTPDVLSMYLQVSEENKEALKESHKKMTKELPESVVDNAFGGRGILMTGSGMYFPVALTAIRWIREQEPDIPIEIYMRNKREYEQSYCDEIFPSLNVECVVGDNMYGEELRGVVRSIHALKSLAILASKFDDIYFMDVDSLPLLKVNDMFDSEVYRNTGYVMTRDSWSRFISPHFYDISGINLGAHTRGGTEYDGLLQKDRKSIIPGAGTESSQLLVKKSKHIRSLMLAAYYNIYGPDVYFPLLMMNSIDDNDKDTYAVAAAVCEEEFYQNTQQHSSLGVMLDGSFEEYVIVQPNPVDDYAAHVAKKEKVAVRGAQAHTANFKANIKYLLNNPGNESGFPPLRPTRNFGSLKQVQEKTNLDVDIELKLFDAMRYAACEWAVEEGVVPKDWRGENTTKYCGILTAQVDFLKGHKGENPNHLEVPKWTDIDLEGKIPELESNNE